MDARPSSWELEISDLTCIVLTSFSPEQSSMARCGPTQQHDVEYRAQGEWNSPVLPVVGWPVTGTLMGMEYKKKRLNPAYFQGRILCT